MKLMKSMKNIRAFLSLKLRKHLLVIDHRIVSAAFG